MKIYERNIRQWYSAARVSFVVILSASSFLFNIGLNDYGYILLSAVLICSVFSMTSLKIYSDRMEVQKFYVFGFIPHTTVFEEKYPVKIISFETELSSADATRIRKFEITKLDFTHHKIRRVTICLSPDEWDLVKEHFIDMGSGYWVFNSGF